MRAFLAHSAYPHTNRSLYDCPACERPCDGTDDDGHHAGCTGDHGDDYPECGWCGEPIDYCTGHGVLNAVDPMSIVPDSPAIREWAAQYQSPGGYGQTFAAYASGGAVHAVDLMDECDRHIRLYSADYELPQLRAAVVDLLADAA
jgi:hypothetical protein